VRTPCAQTKKKTKPLSSDGERKNEKRKTGVSDDAHGFPLSMGGEIRISKGWMIYQQHWDKRERGKTEKRAG